MKVLVISASFPPMRTGEATNAAHMCEQLAAAGVDVHVLTSKGASTDAGTGIMVHALMQRWSWREVPRLCSFLRRCSPDVIYLMYLGWTYQFQFMSTFLATLAKIVLPGTPVVTRFENVGGANPDRNTIWSRAFRKAIAVCSPRGTVDYEFGTLLSGSDAIVLLSGRHEAVLEERLPGVGGKCLLMPPPPNMRISAASPESRARGRARLGLEAGEIVMAFIGFIYPGKGLETLLRATRQLVTDGRRIRLVVIGGSLAREFPDRPSYLEELTGLARLLDVDRHTIWTGAYSSESDEASTFLRAADICVLPFDTGVKLNNSSFSSAAAHGLPIVTTRDARLEPQFIHGQNVFLCESASADALAAALRVVLDDEAIRLRLADGALQLASEWYSWETMMTRTLDLFAGLTHEPLRVRALRRPAASA